MFGSSLVATFRFLGQAWQQHRQTRYTRARVHELLTVTRDPEDKLSRLFDIVLVSMIVLNILAVMLESVASISGSYQQPFFVFEAFSVAIFGLEYLLRVWSCIEQERYRRLGPIWGRLRYMISPMALTDLVAILPFFIILSGLDSFVDLRFLRILRLRRAFKLTRYSPSMDNVFGVLRAELPTLSTIGFIFLLVIIMAASTIFALEGKSNPAFTSIPSAMRWAVASLSGFGETGGAPQTVMGRVFGLLISVAGVLLVAMVTGVLASGFTFARFKRQDAFRRSVEIALERNGGQDIDAAARAKLDFERKAMGFTALDAQLIINQVMEEHFKHDPDKLEELRRIEEDLLG